VSYTNVAQVHVHNAAAVDALAGPDTSDRNTAFAGLSGSERFVQALYLDELGRAGSRGELDSWVAVLDGSAASQAVVALDITQSEEARTYLVKSWYLEYLGREAEGGEEQGWVNALLLGESEEGVLSSILGSDEFYLRAQTLEFSGSADERYVEALYQVLLGRTATSNEQGSVMDIFIQVGTEDLALGFLDSQEFRADQVEGCYAAWLHRPSDGFGRNGWVESGLGLSGIGVGIESSPEFFANG
jgi:hypothetical protein